MEEHVSGYWRFWSGTIQEVLDSVSENESSLESIKLYPNASQGEFLCAIVRFKNN